MKKDRTLKYIILIFMAVMSFFVFSNNGVSAITFSDESSKVNLELEENSDGYTIIGASTTETNILNWTIPDEYESKPIIAIKDGTEHSVLESLSGVVSGNIIVGSNINVIGDYAFKNFVNVKEIYVPESVVTIGLDAFFNCTNLEIVKINRFFISGDQYTKIKNNETAGLNDNVKIVFPSSSLKNNYTSGAEWNSELVRKFTYEVIITLNYVYPDASVLATSDQIVGYFGLPVGNAMFINDNLKDEYNISSLGFNFDGWYNGNTKINKDTLVMESMSVYPKWQLKDLQNVNIATYYVDENLDLVKYNDGDTTVEYGDKKDGLKLMMTYTHELGENLSGVSYTWYKAIGASFTSVGNDEIYGVRFVNDSGIYKCRILVSFAGKDGNNNDYTYETFIEKQINIVVQKRNLIINVNDNTTEYGVYVLPQKIGNKYYSIDETTSLAYGEYIDDNDVTTFSNFDDEYKNVGNYLNALKLVVNKITDGVNNRISNYNVTYNYGNLNVVSKNVSINLSENKVIEYGDNGDISLSLTYNIYGEEENVTYYFERENLTVKDVGEYAIIGVSCNNSNYLVSLNNSTIRKLVITPKKAQVVWSIDDNLVYDGTTKNATAKYFDNDGVEHELSVVSTKNEIVSTFKNAGEYMLTARMSNENTNYLLYYDVQITKVIEKAESILSGAERQTKIYNGHNQYVLADVNHYEAIIKQRYSQRDECKNVTTNSSPCLVVVYVDETENYKAASKNFNLYIEPYQLTVSPNVFEVIYGMPFSSTDLSMLVDGVEDERIAVYFVAANSSTQRDVGEYDIIGISYASSNNYRVSMVEGSGTNKLHVVPMPLTVEFYYYENLVYDGNVKNIGIRIFGTEVDKETIGLQVNYGDKPIRNAGNYTINVSLTNSNYKITNSSTLQFSISKANYNIADLKLEDKKVNYNFSSHFINLQGNLPTGLKAVYTIDGHPGNGTVLPFKHIVKVTFEGDFENYNYIEPMTAVLNISTTWIWITLGSIVAAFGITYVVLYLLIKNKKLVIVRNVSRRKIRRIIRKNRRLNSINEIIKTQSEKLSKTDENIEIEEPVKFVKNTVYVSSVDDAISMSFVDKLFKSEYGTKQFYSEVKNELLSYEGIVSKIKRDYETFYLNNIPVAKFDIVDGKLVVYFALDPTQYKKDEYHHENASNQKVFAPVPLKLVVNSIESLRHAKMFVRIIRKREHIKSVSNFVRTDYVKVYTAKEGTFKLFRKTMAKKDEEIED